MAQHRAGSSDLLAILALTRVEWRIGRRSPVFRLALVAAFLFGFSVGGEPGRGVALSAYSAAEAACQYLGFAAIVWMSLVAVRESTLRTDVLVYSKPQPGERLALSKFVGAYLQLLCMLLAMFAGSAVGRAVNGGLMGLEAYVPQFVRAAVVIGFAASASYMLALLFDSALAGTTVGLYWLLILSGKAFLGKYYFPSYTQNLGAYVALSLALLFLTLCLYGRSRRGSARPAAWARMGAPILALVAAWQFWAVINGGHDPDVHLNPAMDRMGAQDVAIGTRAAGFTLPDQHGRLTGLSDYDGQILVIALWSPQDPDSVLLLDKLNDVQARFASAGVQPIAVTICEDVGATNVFAGGERLRYPVVADWGTYNAPRGSDFSPLSTAYRATSLPTVIVTDRRRTIKAIYTGLTAYDGETLTNEIGKRLKEEPQ